ncbi:MAG: DNA repair exonuclease [Planctomycetales bacterium]|nr:DNA repair exonuclease [Planctomycetales bacterium]
MRFIHTADLHIDSPLRGLSRYEGAPVDRLRSATRQAFENVVAVAIERRVDFMVIAGDLFDGDWPDMQTGLWTARQFRRLEHENIHVYLLRGNHDAASQMESHLEWPSNVHCFAEDQPSTFTLEGHQVALHGQGFADRETREDLVAGYPPAVPEVFNIGVLHTSLSGGSDHDVYAPTTENALLARGYEYWALGHIHARRVVHESPWIVYPGNTQGRHIRETGEKGCYLVEVRDREVTNLEFLASDTIRWHYVEIDCGENDGVPELLNAVRSQLSACRGEANGRYSAVRVVLRGRCRAHRELSTVAARSQLFAQVCDVANELDEEIWIESLKIYTGPAVNLEQLRASPGLLGQLLKEARETADDEDELNRLARGFAKLEERAGGELEATGINLHDPATIRRWLEVAEMLVAGQLVETEA